MAAKKIGPPRVTVETTPVYPVPGRPFRLRGTRQSGTTGTHFRIWCTAAPVGTKLRKQLDETRADRVAFVPLLRISDDAGGPNRFDVEFTLEKGGGYVLRVEEIRVGSGFTGGYEADPRGAPSEDIVGAGVSTLYIASPLSLQLGCGNDIATLRLFVHHDTVIQTELPVHGDTTPRIELSPSATPKSRLAAEATSVKTALSALAGIAAATLVGDLSAGLDNLIANAGAHFLKTGSHFIADDDNAVNDSFAGATTAASRASALQALRKALAQHMRNDDGSGTGSHGYHTAADWANLPLDAAAATDALTDGIAQADTFRAYEAHRVSAVHKSADGSNKATALPPLLELHRAFLAELAAASIAAPDTGQSGAALLISQLGFKDS
jgi:hypothetical protein